MGSAQSYMPSELTVAAVIVVGLAFCYIQYIKDPSPSTALPSKQSQKAVAGASKRGSKKLGKLEAEESSRDEARSQKPVAVPSPPVFPGGFDIDAAPDAPAKPKKSKKKKAVKQVASGTPTPAENQSEASAAESSSRRKRQSTNTELDDSEAWTRVESRRRQKPTTPNLEIIEGKSGTELMSDAGVTTSVTGTSSPVTERTEDEAFVPTLANENRRPLAERMLPKPRKTGVDDMLETSDYSTVSRVMRVQPRPDEKPVPGFSWADYEDVHVAAEDADGEDDGGWGVVKNKSRSRSERPQQQDPQQTQTQTSAETKKQRQNAAKREAQKAAKAAAEAERLATLARHKKELETAKISEQYSQKSGKKNLGGGATASVNEKGQLVWD